MKLKLIILPLWLVAIQAFAFEGAIKQVVKNYNGTGMNVTTTWYLGQHSCRLDMVTAGKDANLNTVFLLDPASGTLRTYAPGSNDKTYYQVNASDVSGGVSVAVSATQETKQINGYKCEKWVVTTSTGVYSVWITRDIGFDWSGYRNFFKTSIEVQALLSKGVKGFPMMTESSTGANAASVESVTAHALEAGTFAVPSEYKLAVSQAQTPAAKGK